MKLDQLTFLFHRVGVALLTVETVQDVNKIGAHILEVCHTIHPEIPQFQVEPESVRELAQAAKRNSNESLETPTVAEACDAAHRGKKRKRADV